MNINIGKYIKTAIAAAGNVIAPGTGEQWAKAADPIVGGWSIGSDKNKDAGNVLSTVLDTPAKYSTEQSVSIAAAKVYYNSGQYQKVFDALVGVGVAPTVIFPDIIKKLQSISTASGPAHGREGSKEWQSTNPTPTSKPPVDPSYGDYGPGGMADSKGTMFNQLAEYAVKKPLTVLTGAALVVGIGVKVATAYKLFS